MPSLSAASRFVAPSPSREFVRWPRAPVVSSDAAQESEDAIRAAETSDTLSLSAAPATADTTTVNVGTLRVVLPPCESLDEGEVIAECDPPSDPPACCCEC